MADAPASSMMIRRAPESTICSAISAAASRMLTGCTTPPAQLIANTNSQNRSLLSEIMATRSFGARPAAVRPPAIRFTRSTNVCQSWRRPANAVPPPRGLICAARSIAELRRMA